MSIFDIEIGALRGGPANLAQYRGKAVLLVNTASKCGLTPQYAGLERLQERYKDRGFTVIGVPSNQFMRQEPGSAEEIRSFCTASYGVQFPLFEKTQINSEPRHPLYAALIAACLIAATISSPSSRSWLANSTIKIPFFAARPTSMITPIWL